MSKFLAGDLIYLPQGTSLYNSIVKSPTIATYIGKPKNEILHALDIFGSTCYISEMELETLNFVRKDVHQAN